MHMVMFIKRDTVFWSWVLAQLLYAFAPNSWIYNYPSRNYMSPGFAKKLQSFSLQRFDLVFQYRSCHSFTCILFAHHA